MTGPRSLFEALGNAERCRVEIPKLIQPEQTAFDMVTLADEIYRLRHQIRSLESRLPRQKQ